MFKLFSKLMMLLVVLAMAGPFILKGPDGRPLMRAPDLHLPEFSVAGLQSWWQSLTKGGSETTDSSQATASVSPAGASISWSGQSNLPASFIPQPGVEYPRQKGVFYRYKDANGIWQFADTPQPGTTNFVSTVDPNANVIQSLQKDKIDAALGRTPAETKTETGKDDKKKDTGLLSNLPFPTTVPPSEIPNLIQQAKDVQNLVNERNKQLDSNKY